MLFFSKSLFNSLKYHNGGVIIPPLPCIGSAINAAIFSAPLSLIIFSISFNDSLAATSISPLHFQVFFAKCIAWDKFGSALHII